MKRYRLGFSICTSGGAKDIGGRHGALGAAVCARRMPRALHAVQEQAQLLDLQYELRHVFAHDSGISENS